jgi:hypothetical protein
VDDAAFVAIATLSSRDELIVVVKDDTGVASGDRDDGTAKPDEEDEEDTAGATCAAADTLGFFGFRCT